MGNNGQNSLVKKGSASHPTWDVLDQYIDVVYLRFMEYAGDLHEVTARQIKQDSSKHLFPICLGTFWALERLNTLEQVILECYDKGITVLVDISWEPVPEAHSIKTIFSKIEKITHDKYFKILVSHDLYFIDECSEFERFFVYYNMFADMIYTYHGTIQKNIQYPYITNYNNIKRYNFSCLAGSYLRHHRLNFITDLFYRNLIDDTFFLSGIPLEKQQKSADLDHVESIEQILKGDKAFYESMRFDQWDHTLQECFNENAELIFGRPEFFEHNDIHNHNIRPKVYYSNVKKKICSEKFISRPNSRKFHWDKIIPKQLLESYINIPLETYFSMSPFYTEKTFKPIVAGVPFIPLMAPKFIESFKRMGFEPYYNIFDYDFDDINSQECFDKNTYFESNDFERISLIVDQVARLSKENNLKSLIKKDEEAILHNQQQIIKISNDTSFLDKL